MMTKASCSPCIRFQVDETGARLELNDETRGQQPLRELCLVTVRDGHEILIESPDFQRHLPIHREVASRKPFDGTSFSGIEPKCIGIFPLPMQPCVLVLMQLSFPQLDNLARHTSHVLQIMPARMFTHELGRNSNIIVQKQNDIMLCSQKSMIHGPRNRRSPESMPDDTAVGLELLERRCCGSQMFRRLIDNYDFASRMLQCQKLIQRTNKNVFPSISRDCYRNVKQ